MTSYLFQIDGAQNNDAFFNALLASASFFYKGATFRVGEAPWVPDGLRVDLEDACRVIVILIELEDTKANALMSSRKYLPEDSEAILRSLREYVDRVISQCQSTGDPRVKGFCDLRDSLRNGASFSVRTAGALRSSTEIIEELPLIDRSHRTESCSAGVRETGVTSHTDRDKTNMFRGVLRLNQERLYELSRCLIVLDAVIRQQDHSGGTFHSWRADRAPLKRLLKTEAAQYPALRQVVVEPSKVGMKLDCESLLSELVSLWTVVLGRIETEDARRLVNTYLPIARKIRGHDQMQRIFEEARPHIKAIEKRTAAAYGSRRPFHKASTGRTYISNFALAFTVILSSVGVADLS